ncbi:hypothetical protein [Loigolactobacillus bifermentans]|uniref:Uncharacterized protein n=1 Tax=Loigolactobacillus bifermentans DSM 20003 TaxID=1423726 RepID=A0A0R1GXY1_9LACO|nr:hypothetical protein [Loigolactobacillus bifermentans]KRK38992.1 hypothetical protein FC07_GL002708 [Loigolactobacillus bifermentans DSM 20003]QGG59122.1 hypothetical protein LB003_00850 [Loigolactobacillus bifermentans]
MKSEGKMEGLLKNICALARELIKRLKRFRYYFLFMLVLSFSEASLKPYFDWKQFIVMMVNFIVLTLLLFGPVYLLFVVVNKLVYSLEDKNVQWRLMKLQYYSDGWESEAMRKTKKSVKDRIGEKTKEEIEDLYVEKVILQTKINASVKYKYILANIVSATVIVIVLKTLLELSGNLSSDQVNKMGWLFQKLYKFVYSEKINTYWFLSGLTLCIAMLIATMFDYREDNLNLNTITEAIELKKLEKASNNKSKNN